MNGETETLNWRRLHAWGLPEGSIRAILALAISATTWGLLVLKPTQEVPVFLRDFLFVIMGHYFAARRRAEIAPELGLLPLCLPHGSVRMLLVAGCVAVAALLFSRGQLTSPRDHPAAVTLLLIGGFLLGVGWNAASLWWRAGRPPHRLVEDVRALITVMSAVILVAIVWNRLLPTGVIHHTGALFGDPDRLGGFGPENILATIVGFYFGSRS